MPLDPSKLAGIWCCRGGGWDFYHLILRPDGIGRAEIYNCVLTGAWTFDWQLQADSLVVSGREEIELNEPQDGVVHVPWALNERIPVALDWILRENGERRRTLRLASPLVDCLPSEYEAGNPAYDLFREPDFSWMRRLRRGN